MSSTCHRQGGLGRRFSGHLANLASKDHPLLRLTGSITFAPRGQRRQPARELVPGPGHAWVGAGVAFKDQRRRAGTLIVVWVEGQQNPWLLFTDLRPRAVGIAWYGLRMWIEMGFKVLKGLGWHWDKTRRTDPDRVARYWLVLAVATILTLATATRIEDAALLALPPAMLHAPPTRPRWRPLGTTRTVSLISQGIADLRRRSLSASSGPDTGSVPSHGPTHRPRSRCTTMIRPNVLIPTPVSLTRRGDDIPRCYQLCGWIGGAVLHLFQSVRRERARERRDLSDDDGALQLRLHRLHGRGAPEARRHQGGGHRQRHERFMYR